LCLSWFIYLINFWDSIIAVAVVNTMPTFLVMLTTRRLSPHSQNQALAQELDAANSQLRATLSQLEKLAVARERNRLARELHDSVTQTVFSMNLSSQSALLLYERDLSQVEGQLNRLNQFAQSALSEMQILISELRPKTQRISFLTLRQHITDRNLQGSPLRDVQGMGHYTEEQGLFRIAQEH
jgi:signal transduction histidine kinase